MTVNESFTTVSSMMIEEKSTSMIYIYTEDALLRNKSEEKKLMISIQIQDKFQ